MTLESFTFAWNLFLAVGFILAIIFGAVVNATNFCNMGAISDWVNIGDLRRFRAWMLAIAIALLGVVIGEYYGIVEADSAFPPYRSGTLLWGANIIGGIVFGIGMTLSSGCGTRTLVRFGAGNLKSVFVLVIVGIIAYYMINPFPNSDQTLYSVLFLPWINHLSVDMGSSQDIGTLISGTENAVTTRLMIGGLLGLGLLVFIFKAADFRKSKDNLIAGFVIGMMVLLAWIFTSVITVGVDDDVYKLNSYYGEWDFLAEEATTKPLLGAPLNPQSYTFINPIGQTLGYVASGFGKPGLTFGILAVFGMIFGSFLYAIFTRSFRVEWFANFRDFINHVIGAAAMGFGGVLALGCTIGQGITGVSTLAVGSFLTLFSIIVGSALTMKVQYYKIVYEAEATFLGALLSSLADMRLLPNSLRKLDKV